MDTNKINLITHIRIAWLSLQGYDFFTPMFAKAWKEDGIKGACTSPAWDLFLWYVKKMIVIFLIILGICVLFAGAFAILTNWSYTTIKPCYTYRSFFSLQFWEDYMGKIIFSLIVSVVAGISWRLHFQAKKDEWWKSAPFFQYTVFLADCLFPDVDTPGDRLLKLHALSATEVGWRIVIRLKELTLYVVKVDDKSWSEGKNVPKPLAYHPKTRMSEVYAKELTKRLCELLECSNCVRAILGIMPSTPSTLKAWYVDANARLRAEKAKMATE